MSRLISTKEAEKHLNISSKRISELCRTGKIKGAVKQKNRWLIPCDTKLSSDKEKLPLPIGISNYCLVSSEYYYVDKTMMIKDFIDERPMVTLFTRPRRFGKTLNMDMLRTFFEKTEKDASIYFKDKKIWKCGKKYQDYCGKYPVIFLTFKDVKFNTWKETFAAIREIFARETRRHKELIETDKCNKYDKEKYERLATGNVDEVELSSALIDLSYMLHKHYGTAPIIIIDEYDTPIQQGFTKNHYDKAILFMRNLFSGGFKDNEHLSFGFLTGILRISKESIFSGLNNLLINSVLDEKYSSYFGFTKEEIKEIIKYYGIEDKYDEICQWYDGYRFGQTDIFNPWSVINYYGNGCKPKAFWISTGSNDIIDKVISKANKEIYDNLNSLINGKTLTTYIDTSVIYPQIENNPSAIYSFLLVSGYLKVSKTITSLNDDFICEVSVPNKEILSVYRKEILKKFENIIPQSIIISIQEAIFSKNYLKIKKLIQQLLIQSVSSFDLMNENFYHGLMLGLCALFEEFFLTSNRESGDGHYDIQLRPRRKGILIELKAKKNCNNDELKKLSQIALKQIVDKKYDTELKTADVDLIYKYGIAFSGKKVEVTME